METRTTVRGLAGLSAVFVLAGGLAVAGVAPAGAARSDDCTVTNSGSYPPGSSSIALSQTTVAQGGTDNLSATGFAKSGQTGNTTPVSLTLCSTPTSLGTATIGADGSIHTTITIPAGTAVGSHIVQAQGPNGNGGTTTVSTDLTVTSAATSTTTGTGNTSLPFTGAEIGAMTVAGVLLVGVGTGLVVVGRKRRSSSAV